MARHILTGLMATMVPLGASLFLAAPGVSADGGLKQGELKAQISKDFDAKILPLFQDLHRNPELSFQETRTAGIVARELRAVGADVHEGIGGTGVIGLMRNGPGPMVMLRADMDALPLEEKSGLPYASTRQVKGPDGKIVHVMHACGHDAHIAALIATARQLTARKDEWSGTVMFLAQPAEELVEGARAMLADGLYERFGTPDYAMGWHTAAGLPAGMIVSREGATSATSDAVEIIVNGVGAHGAYPHQGKDPVVIGAQIVLALQTIVSREQNPHDPAVITVGTFNAGNKNNVISDRAVLQLTVRADNEKTRAKLFESIKRVARGVGVTNGLPEDKLPQVSKTRDGVTSVYNDIPLTRRMKALFTNHFGATRNITLPKNGMGAEDFGEFARPATNAAGFFFAVGVSDPAELAAAKNGGPAVGGQHSPIFKVQPKPSITTAVEAMTIGTMDLLRPKG